MREFGSNQSVEQEIDRAELFVDRQYLAALSSYSVRRIDPTEKNARYLRLFRVVKIMYDEREDTKDKLTAVYNAVRNFRASIVLLIRGTRAATELYLGIRSMQDSAMASNVLIKGFMGNFPGSELVELDTSAAQAVLAYTDCVDGISSASVSCVDIVPSLRSEKRDDRFVQGLEKFIDTMRGEEYLCEIIAAPVDIEGIVERRAGYEALYSILSPFAKTTLARGRNEATSLSTGLAKSVCESINESVSRTTGRNKGTNRSETKGFNIGASILASFGFSSSTTEGTSTGTQTSRTTQQGSGKTTGVTSNESETRTSGTSDNLTVEQHNKKVEFLLDRIDAHLDRLRMGEASGLWECAAYFVAGSTQTSVVSAGAFKALMLGEKTNVERAYLNYLHMRDPADVRRIAEYLRYLEHPVFLVGTQEITPTTHVTGDELPLLAGMPRKSVVGVTVSKMAEFGRDIHTVDAHPRGDLALGKVFHMNAVEDTDIRLNIEDLTAHCFVTGTTGSGKSNAVFGLIEQLIARGLPFLVVEPAKGEYKYAFANCPGISVFGTNPATAQFLKLNPFKFRAGVHVLEHLDRLIEVFNACWEMYAAMPAILKDAVEAAYMEKGWDLLNSVYLRDGEVEYPTFLDLLNQLPRIIERSRYSADTKGDYIGALVTRVNSLTNGIYGQIFCDSFDLPDEILFDERAIVDLSRVGSSETKSLIMGMLVLKLTEHRMTDAAFNAPLRHVTIIEEAHNLLKNTKGVVGTAGNTIIAKSVEMIAAGIAEMRTYGEGFIIVDQSPTSVDMSAIKNTNTKIIMRLPDKEDCEIAGHSVSLDEHQTRELARLPRGVAAVMQNNWLEALLVKLPLYSGIYRGERPPIAFERLAAFRSEVIGALLDEYARTDRCDEGIVLGRIERFDICREKKEEMARTVRRLCALLGRKFDSVRLGNALTHIAGCGDILRMSEERLDRDETGALREGMLDRWYRSVERQLKTYIDIDDANRDLLIQYMVHAKRFETARVNYSEIYRLLYEPLV